MAHPSPQSASLLQVSLLKPGPYPTDIVGGGGGGWGGAGVGGTPRVFNILPSWDPNFAQRQEFSELSGKTVNSKLPRVFFECIKM